METRSLKKEERLRLRRDFDRVFSKGESVKNEYLRVVFTKNEIGFRRIGVVVRRKIGKAVYRNRLRRLIKEVFRNNKDIFPESVDVVFLVRDGLKGMEKGMNYWKMLEMVRDVLNKMKEEARWER